MLVSPTGGRLWRFRYRLNGVEKLLTFGAYPDVSLKRAREKRDDARKLVADEVDPRFEFRRSLFRRKGVERVIIYSSTPEQRVIGEFRIEGVLSLAPDALWSKTHKHAGIDRAHFDSYFFGKCEAHAIKVGSPRRYEQPLDLLRDFGLTRPPQSFCYV
jgi:predicted transcriptional regulator